ncbi:MAG: sugar-specific transcriptional regulator TrmB [Patescibacteria group bacterium]|jgi:sugar-specific transcriptional regulator TrmB
MNTQLLEDIGLSENEKEIYLTLIKHNTQTAYELAKLTGINRAHIYDKLEHLIHKGLVSYAIRKKRKVYKAYTPEKLNDYIKEKQEKLRSQHDQLQQLIPQLLSLQNIEKSDTQVEVFEGKEGLKSILKDIAYRKSNLDAIGIDDTLYRNTFGIYMDQFFRDLKISKSKERIITTKAAYKYPKAIAKTTRYKYLDAKDFNPTNTFIYSNVVAIVIWGTPIIVIKIENNNLSKTYKEHFEHLWKIAKPL